MKLSEQAAYLRGLADGMGMNENDQKDKLVLKMVDLLIELSEKAEALETRCNELSDYADELDSDLGDIEEYLFTDEIGEDDEDDFDCDEDELYEALCPSCGEIICFDESCDPEKLICPACGEEFDAVCEESCEGDCDSCSGCE